jgi:hypothetical protein
VIHLGSRRKHVFRLLGIGQVHGHCLPSATSARGNYGVLARDEVLFMLREQQPENENDGAALLIAATASMMAGIIASF